MRAAVKNQPARPANARIFGLLVVGAAWCLGLGWVAEARCQPPDPPAFTPSAFENPRLRYLGPDPTAHSFLPGLTWEEEAFSETAGPPEVWDPSAFIVAPDDDEALDPWLLAEPLAAPPPLSEHKQGFFQKASFTATWLPRDGSQNFGLTELDSLLTVAVPFPTRNWPLLISPTYNVRFVDGPQEPHLPPRLQEALIDFMWVPKISDRWLFLLAAAPTLRSDFEVKERDALRVTGKAIVRYDYLPDRLQLALGVLYLNREDVRLLPVGGIIWKPTADQNYELIFPRPKLARRLRFTGHSEDWVYVGGEFGGNSYRVERLPGVLDHLTLFDIRAYVGWERKRDGGAGGRVELGYVFAREAEYLSGAPGSQPDDTFMVRVHVAY